MPGFVILRDENISVDKSIITVACKQSLHAATVNVVMRLLKGAQLSGRYLLYVSGSSSTGFPRPDTDESTVAVLCDKSGRREDVHVTLQSRSGECTVHCRRD